MERLIDLSSSRPAPDVSAQPRVELADWRVLMDYEGERFLVGILPSRTTLRITTALRAIDPSTRMWVTQSGRHYETPGPPARDSQLREQMVLLARASGLPGDSQDVTDAVWSAMQRAVQ